MLNENIRQIESISYHVKKEIVFDGKRIKSKGKVIAKREPNDEIFGFFFSGLSGKDETLYDGIKIYEINHKKKYYFSEIPYGKKNLGFPGGRLVSFDLITELKDFENVEIEQEKGCYILHLRFPNEGSLFNIRKRIKVDHELLLPIEIESSFQFQSNGNIKTRSEFTKLTGLLINNQENQLPTKSFLKNYTYQPPVNHRNHLTEFIGKKAPSLEVKDFSGKREEIHFTQATLLVFWELWCGESLKALPEVELLNNLPNKNFQIISVISEAKRGEIEAFINQHQIRTPIYSGDRKSNKNYNVLGVPQIFIIDKEGNVLHAQNGWSSKISAILDQLD
jgi:hypothetical protein